ncbi:hypothetical protein ACTXT7_001134, partial [Hymenolepis weldensis]
MRPILAIALPAASIATLAKMAECIINSSGLPPYINGHVHTHSNSLQPLAASSQHSLPL